MVHGGEHMSAILSEGSWSDVVESFAESGLSLGVLEAKGGTFGTLGMGCASCLLSPPDPDRPGSQVCVDPGLLQRPARSTVTLCSAGMPCAVHPIVERRATVGYAFVAGYVSTAAERKRLLERLLERGVQEKAARAIARNTPVMDPRRAAAMARLAAAHAENLLSTVVPARQERQRALEYEVLYQFGRGFEAALADFEGLPEMILERALWLTSADSGALMLVDGEGKFLETVATRGDDSFKPPARTGVGQGILGQAAGAGRSIAASGRSGECGGGISLAVPLVHEGDLLGLIVLSSPNGDREMSDELKLLDLYGASAASALSNARRYAETSGLVLELSHLNELSRALHTDSEADRIAYLVTGVLDKVLDFEVGGLLIPSAPQLSRVVVRTEIAKADLVELLSQVAGESLSEKDLESCEFVTGEGAITEAASSTGVTWSIIASAVTVSDRSDGRLFAAVREPNAFGSSDTRLLGAEATHASLALERAGVCAKLRDDQVKLVHAMSAMVDAAERCQKGHADRVMDYSVAIGEEMGLARDDIETLRFAGLLHDVGKIGVTEQIVLKPAALREDEMAQVKRHAQMGADIVEQMEFLGSLRLVVLHHHEWWDGSGYPAGLAGEDIPLLARILSVADAYDAMTCDRAYSKALPLASARRELKEGAGRQFGPEIVAAFLRILDRRAESGATGLFASGGAPDSPELPA